MDGAQRRAHRLAAHLQRHAAASASVPIPEEVDVLVIGAGFAGLYALHKLRATLPGLRAHVVDKADGVGGTWFWNRYPGARCDVPSMEYSYSFSTDLQQEWEWSELMSGQPEILRYLNHVADRFRLRDGLSLGADCEVERMAWCEPASESGAGASADSDLDPALLRRRIPHWRVTFRGGQACAARFVIAATGCLSSPTDAGAQFPGLADFAAAGGAVYRTSLWPKAGVDFAGKDVVVVGTGSSGIQSIPEIGINGEI